MERPASTYRALLPLTTPAIVSDIPYHEQLDPGSPYRDFALALERYDRNPNLGVHWGTCAPALLLHDGEADDMPRVPVHRIGGGKLALKVVEGFMMYTTAVLLFDTIIRVSRPNSEPQQVLKHFKNKYWIGQNQYLPSIADVSQTLSVHLGQEAMANNLTPSSQPTSEANAAVRLANEVSSTQSRIGWMTAVKNIATLALCIAVMSQGYMQVPESVATLGMDATHLPVRNLQRLLSQPRRLRVALLIAIGISPLLVFVEGDIMKHPVCIEEALFNTKRFGNQKPQSLRSLEDNIWREILSTARGEKSAFGAYQSLQRTWSTNRIVDNLPAESRFFYDRPGVVLYNSERSLYEAQPQEPYPEKWPMSPLTLRFIQDAKNAPPDEEIECEVPVATAEVTPGAQVVKPNKGVRKRPRPATSSTAPNATSASTQLNNIANDTAESPTTRTQTPQPGSTKTNSTIQKGTQPRKRKKRQSQRKRSRSTISEDADDDSPDDIPDLELLDFSDLQDKDDAARGVVYAEVVEMLEECEVIQSNDVPDIGSTDQVSLQGPITKYTDTVQRTMRVWDASGGEHDVSAQFHLREDYDAWMYIYDVWTDQLVNEGAHEPKKPAFMVNPASSPFSPHTSQSFAGLTAREVQTSLGEGSVVLTGTPGPILAFNKKGLETLDDMHRRITLQDLSISINRNHKARCCGGDLSDLLASSCAAPGSKKALNALDLPNPCAAVEQAPYSSDVRAVWRTKPYAGCITSIPNGDVRFGMAATEGAVSFWHFDPHGQGTFLRVAVGTKLCAIAVPKDPRLRSSTRLWTSKDLDVRRLDLTQYQVEIILLRPGDTLLLEPGVIHAVLTLTDSICHGGHYLPISCLKQIVVGAIHDFFEGRVATNSETKSFWPRLNSIAAFFYRFFVLETPDEDDEPHLPDIYTSDGMGALVLFACLIEVQHVVSWDSYSHTDDEAILAGMARHGYDQEEVLNLFDVSKTTRSTRIQRIYTRGCMVAVLQAVFRRVNILDNTGIHLDGWEGLYLPSLAWFICALKDYHGRSSEVYEDEDDEHMLGIETMVDDDAHVTPPPQDLFFRQLSWTTDHRKELMSAVEELERTDNPVDNLVYPMPAIRIERRNGDIVHGEGTATSRDTFRMGLRGSDSLYFSAYAAFTGLEPPDREASVPAQQGERPQRGPVKRRKL